MKTKSRQSSEPFREGFVQRVRNYSGFQSKFSLRHEDNAPAGRRGRTPGGSQQIP